MFVFRSVLLCASFFPRKQISRLDRLQRKPLLLRLARISCKTKVRTIMTTSASKSTVIYLVRNDLRIHDNEALYWAQQYGDFIVPLFCFDNRIYGTAGLTWHFGFPKTAGHRTRFILEGVSDMRGSLRKHGSDLVVRSGQTTVEAVTEIIQLCREQSGNRESQIALVYQREIAKEEIDVEAELHQLCNQENVTIKTFWGLTLYHLDDLPFPSIQSLPDTYTGFRKNVEARCQVRPLMPMPEKLKSLPSFIRSDCAGAIPTLDKLVADPSTASRDSRSAFPFSGGETSSLERLNNYLWETNHVAKYKETRNGLIGTDYSTKFSPWLAVGALSPRQVFHSIKKYETECTANQSTYWVIFELLWRDYFKFINLKYGDCIFYLSGIMKKTGLPWKQDMSAFDQWRYGRTGVPFVDANMRELLHTGWMSNRGRQNVASFLVKDLGLDWRMGAEWFESLLVDHDVSSNYGNWNYSAGIGNDPRENRKFNMIKQALDYDPEGNFVRLWVPELAALKGAKIHAPWLLSVSELKVAGVVLGDNYPRPMVVPPEWSRHMPRVKSAGQSRQPLQKGVDFYFKTSSGGSGSSRKRH